MLTCTCEFAHVNFAGFHANDFYISNYSIRFYEAEVAPTASIEHATLCGDQVCRGRRMQVQLRFEVRANPFAEIVRAHCAECK